MIVDSHFHLWRRARGDHGWLTPDLGPLWRDFTPADAAAEWAAAGVAGGILVQAAPTAGETAELLGLARADPKILGVVGWADFADPAVEAAIAALAVDPLLKGLRPMLQDLDDDDFILSPAADRALAAMEAAGLVFEALVRPRHLPRLIEVRARHPRLAIVVDHAAKPDIAGGALEPWAADLARLAADGATCCKLSGLLTEAGPGATAAELAPFTGAVLAAFGPNRVLWGSDWPVLTLAGTYGGWLAMARDLTAGLTAAGRAAAFAGTARRVYGLS